MPREDDGGGFSEAGGDVDEAGLAGGIFGQPTLVVVGSVAGGLREEVGEIRSGHG